MIRGIKSMGARAARNAALVLLGVACAACASSPESEMAGEPETTFLVVDNQSRYDMTIYVVRTSGQRIRIGRATSNMQTRLVIPPDLLFGLTSLRFLADPLAGNVSPVSDEIVVTPGDEITLRIPPM